MLSLIKGAVPSPTATPSPVAVLPQATPSASVPASSTPTLSAHGTTFYVSKTGSNPDGESLANAWNELDQINWAAIQPGDTIMLDGERKAATWYTIPLL